MRSRRACWWFASNSIPARVKLRKEGNMFTEQLQERDSIALSIFPQSAVAGTYTTGGVDASKFHRTGFILKVGSVGAAGTVSAKLQESTDDVTYTDIASSSITTITASNKVATLELAAGSPQMTKRYIRLSVTVAVNAVLIDATPIGTEARYKKQTSDDASVTQRLVVPVS